MSRSLSLGQRIAQGIVTAPILAYRYTFSGLVGGHCRHLPTCSDYGREAVAVNGAWRGGWLTLARLWRCSPWGSHGFDPVPDIRNENHPFAPWRYGRWRLCSERSPETGEDAERHS
ncbi:putative membrane protein insertion efficiency factor [Methyloligella halotolerans]|uniref:Putative membrane protein insertion efficiency factor n=1 Tax=Methyloligella halotolerans TaxID=1177755 RepID=A0A1E2S154_9HYPH|nr:membrane protein insertion efficiency factor YidD [Methyloligella halotolerans]ODA68217.1 putative membrane protein insertion efficiency factor [Methyloligella halotolerans]